jgi:tape measure domain-containing protein
MTEKRIRVRLDAGNTKAEIKSLNSEMKGLGSTSDKTTDSMRRLTSVAQAVATALASAQIVKYADSWTTVNNRLNQATSSASEFVKAQKGVISIAQASATDLEGVASAYSRLAQATSELGLSQDQLLNVTSKLTLALKAGGATADETSSVMIQLAQGLGSGALQGDELRSILEASIPISKALAAEFGVNVGQLKTLGSQGLITADKVISAIENMDESALSFTKTFADGLTNVNNSLTVYVGEINESLGVTKTAGEALNSLANNIEIVGDGLIVVATIFGARLAGSIAGSTAALIAYTRQSLAASVQTNALGQVVARTTVAMNAQALAARGASAAMGLLGGPLGVALIAAAAILYFAETAETAQERTKRLSDEVQGLTKSYTELNEKQRQIELTNINNEFKALQLELQNAQKKLNTFKNFGESPIKTENVRKYKGEIERINTELDKLSVKQQAVFNAGFEGVEFTDATDSNVKPSIDGKTGGKDDPAGVETKNIDFSGSIDAENTLLQQSLDGRLAAYAKYYEDANNLKLSDEERALADQALRQELAIQTENDAFAAELERIANRNAAIQDNKSISDAEKLEVDKALLTQKEILEKEHENKLTRIKSDGANQRLQLQQAAFNAEVDSITGFASSSLSLLSSFGKQSFKTQKIFAIADSVVNIAGGVAKALNNPYPANLGFAAQVAAQGAGLLATIKSSEPSSSASSVSVPRASAVSTPSSISSTIAPTAPTQSTQRVFNIELPDSGFVAVDTVSDILKSLAENNEDMQIAISKGQKQAARVGAI